jgi:hypothetical protein
MERAVGDYDYAPENKKSGSKAAASIVLPRRDCITEL